MPHDTEDMIQLLLSTNKEQEQTIVDLRATIKELRSTIANLNETIDEKEDLWNIQRKDQAS